MRETEAANAPATSSGSATIFNSGNDFQHFLTVSYQDESHQDLE
jgi:hypothetical protein